MTDTPENDAPNAEQPHPGTGGDGSKDERMWGMLCHLAALAGFVVPFGNILGPLVVWLIKKEEFDFVADQGKEALNFQITVAIAGLICIPFMPLFGLGILMSIVVVIAALVLTVKAAIKANEGVAYRYPYALKLVK